ncbi:DUF4113 domain-containing protein [Microbulbifer sp. DLAB2-AA]|uniref:DUF4113 domain-containing protein n=1 Tax=Microbulbifer sp. DLAB2-AA TaxID=3243394 RepID=UPI004039AEA4
MNEKFGLGTLFLGAQDIQDEQKVRQAFTSPANTICDLYFYRYLFRLKRVQS